MSTTSLTRFSTTSDAEISKKVLETTPNKTLIRNKSIWCQFETFCNQRDYKLDESTPVATLGSIMKDWAYNMKRSDGGNYREAVVKTMWNKTANILQEIYYNDFKRSFDPFKDIEFKSARDARNAKRKVLQTELEGQHSKYVRKKLKPLSERYKMVHAANLTDVQLMECVKIWDENTPCGLQRKFFFIASYELAWEAAEATECLVHYFRKEIDKHGLPTGRIEYNTTLPRTPQDGVQKPSNESGWLRPNHDNPEICPVRLFDKLISKRSTHFIMFRLFLTPNGFWNTPDSSGWYKNVSVGINQIARWLKNFEWKVSARGGVTNESIAADESEDDEEELEDELGAGPSHSAMSERVDQENQSNILNDMGTEEPDNTKRCRTCLVPLHNPRNLFDPKHKHLLKILQCLLEMQIKDETFEICRNCEGRLLSVIQTKELCLKSMQRCTKILCKEEIKEEPMEIMEDSKSSLDIAVNNFEDVFIKEQPDLVEVIQDSTASVVPVNHSTPTTKNINTRIAHSTSLNIRKDVYLPDRPFVQCKRGPKTLSEYHLPHQVLQYSKHPTNEVLRAINVFNTARNIPKLRTCIQCYYVGQTANRLLSHMSSKHRDIMKTWCFECNIQSDNILAHRVTEKCSYFFCKFCNKHCTPLSQAERHFRNHCESKSPGV